jgi:hypothetical protein
MVGVSNIFFNSGNYKAAKDGFYNVLKIFKINK